MSDRHRYPYHHVGRTPIHFPPISRSASGPGPGSLYYYESGMKEGRINGVYRRHRPVNLRSRRFLSIVCFLFFFVRPVNDVFFPR